MSDARDERMMLHRVDAVRPLITALVIQMDAEPRGPDTPEIAMATFLMMGLERTVTVNTDDHLKILVGLTTLFSPERYLRPPPRLLEVAIREARRSKAT